MAKINKLPLISMLGLCFMLIKSNCYSLMFNIFFFYFYPQWFPPYCISSQKHSLSSDDFFLYCCNIGTIIIFILTDKPHSLLKITLYFTHFAYYILLHGMCSLFNHWNSQNWQMPVLSVVTNLRSIKSSNRSLLCNKII